MKLDVLPVFDKFLNNGAEMFIAMRLAPTEEEHAAVYHSFMDPAKGAVIVDLGCGVGGLGHQLLKIDPSLHIINVVKDPNLIAKMNHLGRECVQASFENTGLPSGLADNVMFNESIGHGELQETLKEAGRLLKKFGILTIKDFNPICNKSQIINFESWGYKAFSPSMVISEAYKQGFELISAYHPNTFQDHWDEIMSDDHDAKSMLGDDYRNFPIKQILYKFIKVHENE